MKKWLLLPLVCMMVSWQSADAQDREYGIRMSDFRDFGIVYKKDKGNYWTRIHASFALLEATLTGGFTGGIGLGMNVGREKRKAMGDRMNFIHGNQFFFNAEFAANNDVFNNSLSGGFGYLIGMTYTFTNDFNISLETIPSISLGLTSNNSFNSLIARAGFNSEIAALVLTKKF